MINKKIFNEEIARLKKIVKESESCEQLKDTLDILYTRISNVRNKGYKEKYNIVEICKNKTIKEIEKLFKNKYSVSVELVEYDKEKCGFLIIYNEFDSKNYPTKWEFYILKGE